MLGPFLYFTMVLIIGSSTLPAIGSHWPYLEICRFVTMLETKVVKISAVFLSLEIIYLSSITVIFLPDVTWSYKNDFKVLQNSSFLVIFFRQDCCNIPVRIF